MSDSPPPDAPEELAIPGPPSPPELPSEPTSTYRVDTWLGGLIVASTLAPSPEVPAGSGSLPGWPPAAPIRVTCSSVAPDGMLYEVSPAAEIVVVVSLNPAARPEPVFA